ncbi:MAG: hypothetical protein Q7J27_00575 [Syntrophales bacterium]|nr:hypothetical protein [Syntrophales bacterium]
MIEECNDILECENRLSPVIPKTSLLGEIPLSTEEVDKLGSFIKEQISDNIQGGTKFLKTKTPTCFACFLVWKGIFDYSDGDYWSGFREFAGLSDPSWQAKWGKIFINFLETNGLPPFDNIKDAHRYVTPILMHGMIPNSCLDEFFEKILLPMVKQDLTDPSDLSFLLKIRREDDNERYSIEKEIEELKAKKGSISSKLNRVRSLIKIWDDLDKIKALEEKVGNRNELAYLPEDPLEYKSKKNWAIQKLQKEIEKLESEKKQCEQQRKKFSEVDKEVLAHSGAINQCINILPKLEQELLRVTELKAEENLLKERIEKDAQSIFFEPWNEKFALIIRELPLDNLKDRIEKFNSIRISESIIKRTYFTKLLTVIKKWMNHLSPRFIKREKTAQEMQVEISEMLKKLPVGKKVIEWPQTELIHNLEQLCEKHETLCQLHEIRGYKEMETYEQISGIKNVAETVGVATTGDIKHVVMTIKTKLAEAQNNKRSAIQAEQQIEEKESNIRELMVNKELIVKELQEIDDHLAELGNGDIQLGIERLEQQRNAQLQTELLKKDLIKAYPDLESLEREKNGAQKNGKDKSYYNSEIDRLDLEIEQIKQKTTELKEKLEQIPEPFPYVDEPTRRFLLYGGDTARDFLVQSAQMVNQAMTEQSVPSADETGLPERVVARFEEWWKEYCKISEGGDEIVSPEKLDRFRSPLIYFDPALIEIKVHFPSQRFSISDKISGICLIINEDKQYSQKEQLLRAYQYNKDCLATEELDFPLPFPSYIYKFTLKSDDQIIWCWNIQGMSITQPFMAFSSNSKRLIHEAELPKGEVLIVLHKEFFLEPNRIVIEVADLHGKWREYKYLKVDLSNVGQLNLVDKQNNKYKVSISMERKLEPTLYGGQILRGCCSEEENIYVGEPPSICIPVENNAEIKGWVVSIPKNSDSTLVESKHYRLNELEEISNIDRNDGLLIIPLSNEKCIGKNPVGRFTVRLRNDVRHIFKRLSFCIVPHLKLGFDKDIYLPCEEGTAQVKLTLDGLEQMKFEPRGQVKIIDFKRGSYRLETISSEHSIHGILRYTFPKGNLIPVPITIEIPRLTWRLDGMPNNEYSSESNKVEEIWFGDLENAQESLSLIVTMPSFINGQGRLSPIDIDQVSEKKICEGKVRFDLLGFSDTLREDDEPLQTFELTVPDSELSIDNVELFTVRTRWEVEDIECIQQFRNGMLILKISWKGEKGKSEGQRVIRLWKIDSPNSDFDEWQVPEDSYGMEIEEEKERIPPGEYRVHIDVDDENSWSSTKPTMPPDDYLNTIDIQVVEEILKGKINIISVIDKNGHKHTLKYRYNIDIEGRISKRTLPDGVDSKVKIYQYHEGWYVGNISVAGRSTFETGTDVFNPVKFEYISTKHLIDSLQDNDNDGVFFCTLCKELFWSLKRYKKERGMGHEQNILSPISLGEDHPEFKMKFKFLN